MFFTENFAPGAAVDVWGSLTMSSARSNPGIIYAQVNGFSAPFIPYGRVFRSFDPIARRLRAGR